jgi:hypothetical protein
MASGLLYSGSLFGAWGGMMRDRLVCERRDERTRFNLLQGGAALYGTHPWHWYITQGLPAVLGPTYILAIWGAWDMQRRLAWLVLWVVGVLR